MVFFDHFINNSEGQDMEEQSSSLNITAIENLNYKIHSLCSSEPIKKRNNSFLNENNKEELEQSSKKFCIIDSYKRNQTLQLFQEAFPKKENFRSSIGLQGLYSQIENIKEKSETCLSKQNKNPVLDKKCWPIASPRKVCEKPKKQHKKVQNIVPSKNQTFINSYFAVSPKSNNIIPIVSESNRTLEDKNFADSFKRKLSFGDESATSNELELILDEPDPLYGISELNDRSKDNDTDLESNGCLKKLKISKIESVKCLNSNSVLPEILDYTKISLDETPPIPNIGKIGGASAKEMSYCYVTMFETILEDEDKAQAVDFISRIPSQYPPSNILNIILYEILQKTTDEYLAHKAYKYACRMLNLLPPKSQKVRKYYLNALLGKENNMWDKMAMIIKCSLCECCVQLEEPSECKNNILLLEFLLDLFHVDFAAFEERGCNSLKKIMSSKRKNLPLITHVFWPMGEVGIINNKCSTLLQFMNDIFKCNLDSSKLNLLGLLQKLLTFVAECSRLSVDCHEMEALNNPYLNDLNEVIIKTCQEAMENMDNLKIFIAGISPSWLQMKLCENLLYNTIFNSHIRNKGNLSLRKIVRQYMYPLPFGYAFNIHETDESGSSSESEVKKLCDPNKRNLKGETPVHRACIRNDYKCLAELLAIPGVNINAVDHVGWTPIHEACISGNYKCVELLLQWQPRNYFLITPREHSTYINILAANKEGTTILHDAVESKNTLIVKLLLKFGGHSLLYCQDSRGRIPIDMAESQEMFDLLKAAEQERFCNLDDEEFNFNGSECSTFKRITPCFVQQAHHSRYLFLLDLLLSNYLSSFKIQNLVQSMKQNSKQSIRYLIGEHLRTLNYPEADLDEILHMCDDVYVARSLPKVINTFVEEITSAGNKMPKEIISLKLLSFCILSVL